MKKHIFTISLLLITLNTVNSQIKLKDTLNYELTYDYSYQENKTDTLNIKSELMVLKVAKNFSYFINYNNMKLREMYSKSKLAGNIPKYRSRGKTRLLFTIIKDYEMNQLSFSDRIGPDYYYYTKPLNQFVWKLENEQKEIMGYQCKKATTNFAGRDYVAWYSVEIPISDGPYKFNGLPGLIFSIYDTDKHYVYNLKNIEKVNSFFNTKDEFFNHIKIDKSDFDELKNRYKKKPSSMMNSGGLKFPKELLDKADKRAKEKLKYENNPMELKDDNE